MTTVSKQADHCSTSSSPSIPRSLLVTWFAPDDRKGGAVIVRSLVEQMPVGGLCWFSVSRPAGQLVGPLGAQSIGGYPPPAFGNVRLKLGRFWDWYAGTIWCRRAAARIASAARTFDAERIWIVLDYTIVPLALELAKLLPEMRYHFSVHDAPVATAGRIGKSAGELAGLQTALNRLSQLNATYDAVSEELLAEHAPPGRQTAIVTLGAAPLDASAPLSPPKREGPLVLACAGNFVGIEEIRAAAAGLNRWASASGRSWKLLIFGPSNLGDLPPGVESRPYCEPDLLWQVFETVDLLYIPMELEGPGREQMRTNLPTRLVSYLAHGKLILAHAPDDSATARIMRNAQLGPVVIGRDPQLMATAVEQALEWDPAAAAEGRRQLLADRFSSQAIFSRFAACLAARHAEFASDG